MAADCGGRGNLASVSDAIREVSGAPAEDGIWNFARPEETQRRLEQAGFSEVEVELHDEPEEFPDEPRFLEFLETIILGSHLLRLHPSERRDFVAAVAALVPNRQVDYARLTLKGRKPN